MASPIEKRTAERFSVGTNTACVFASPVLEDFGPVKLLNISLNGIGFTATEKLPEKILLAIKLQNVATKISKTLLVRVIHVTPQPGGTYLIGGELDTPLTYEELRQFVLRLPSLPAK
jgi:hypothetical protein